ncbi:hypothetical protein GCM10009753_14910 [Streptantibioticus ferralitis]
MAERGLPAPPGSLLAGWTNSRVPAAGWRTATVAERRRRSVGRVADARHPGFGGQDALYSLTTSTTQVTPNRSFSIP